MRITTITCCAVATLCATACGGDHWREVDARLNAAAQPARAEGFAPLSGPYNGFGRFGASFVVLWDVRLDSGVAYVIGAACTEDCIGIGMSVSEPAGPVLARDTTDGPYALARLTAPAGGTYTIELSGWCEVGARCWWASQVYGKDVPGMRPGFAGGER